MPADSSSAASSTGIQAPGGSIMENSPGVIVAVLVAVVVLFLIFARLRKKKGGSS